MKLNKLVEIIKAQTKIDDPDVRILNLSTGNVCEPDPYHRSEYFDETLYGNILKHGNYVILECVEEL